MTEQQLKEAANRITGGRLSELTYTELTQFMTVTQYLTHLCLNEVERRGELTFFDGDPIVPYVSEHSVETILTRS